jgi:short-subunit dehydrogenase
VVLITGAGRGIGASLIHECASRKAKKIYATDLNMDNLYALQKQYPKVVVPVKLDVTNIDNVKECRQQCGDVTLLINNAGVECATRFTDEKAVKAGQFEMTVNYFGTHNLCSVFWDSLKEKESAAIVNMLSVASFILILKLGTYCASKAAAHSLTQSLRKESEGTSLSVHGVYPGYVDTEMTKNIDVEKVTPEQIAVETCNGIENNILNIFPDKMSRELSGKMNFQSPIYSQFSLDMESSYFVDRSPAIHASK